MSTAPDNTSFIRAPIAVVLAWLIPGLGHIYLGYKTRGIVFLVTITLAFGTGVAIGGVKTVSYERVTWKSHRGEQHMVRTKSWWFFGQILNGTYAIATYAAGQKIDAYEELKNQEGQEATFGPPHYLAWPSGDIGSVYSGVAGLLNLLVIIDALARAENVPPPPRRRKVSHG